MKKEILKNISNKGVYVEYDESKYSIEDDKSEIILKNIETNTVLTKFTSFDTYFIIQYNNDDETYFMVGTSENFDEKLTKYVVKGNSLKATDKYSSFSDIDYCRISDSKYRICVGDTMEITDINVGIWNIDIDEISYFERIYDDKDVNQHLDENVLMVSKRINSYSDDYTKITDTIFYGIDKTTLKIITPIYSSIQDRFIDVYTEEQLSKKIDEVYAKDGKLNQYINGSMNLEEATINNEIRRYLELLVIYTGSSSIYNGNSVNEEFIKKFNRKK